MFLVFWIMLSLTPPMMFMYVTLVMSSVYSWSMDEIMAFCTVLSMCMYFHIHIFLLPWAVCCVFEDIQLLFWT